MAEYDQPHMELVKCVVVGDAGVGKTRLVCSRACGSRYTLPQLMQTHIPTVWAIDNYNIDREILEMTFCEVDGVDVSLRLWDTFGYHDKDRRFACSRADVVLICFSVVRPITLRNVWNVWFREIKYYCPGTPIVLCGCQTDLRYLHKNDEFMAMDKGLFFQEVKESAIITPEQGRAVAHDIGAEYYETSVLTQQGVDHMFQNTARAALVERRRMRFWNPQLKRINFPMCQPPTLPPSHIVPEVKVLETTYLSDFDKLLNDQEFSDVVLIAQGVNIYAHQVVLLSASSVFQQLFCCKDVIYLRQTNKKSNSPTADLMVQCQDGPQINSDKEKLILHDGDEENNFKSLPSAFHSVYMADNTREYPSQDNKLTVVLNSDVPPAVFKYILQYLYTGKAVYDDNLMVQLKETAKLFELDELADFIQNEIDGKSAFVTDELEKKFLKKRSSRFRDIVLKEGTFSDVLFDMDDGCAPAHKSLLVKRCDWMSALLTDNFRESSAKVISMPGVTVQAFNYLLEYIYIDMLSPDFSLIDPLDLIELSNRLCLPRMLSLVELLLVQFLMKAHEVGENVMDNVIALLEPAQCFNACQLASWCLSYLCNNYQVLHNKYYKHYRMLHPDNQDHILRNRWPPLWYLKELDYYEKRHRDEERELLSHQKISSLKRQRKNSGCLCFAGRKHKVQRECSTDIED